MPKLILVLLLLVQLTVYAQNSDNRSKELQLICKTWGYLKYYHAEVRSGEVDWNAVLLTELNGYFDHGVKPETVVDNLLKQAGRPRLSKKTYVDRPEDAKVKVIQGSGFEWIKDLPQGQAQQLSQLRTHFCGGNNHYALNAGGKVVDFKHDVTPALSELTTPQLRLLALFRYWNIITYYFPNKHLLTESWDNILLYYIDEMLQASSELDVELVMFGMNNALNDAHAMHYRSQLLYERILGRYGTALSFEIVEGRIFLDGYSSQSAIGAGKLMIGDEILICNKGTYTDLVEKVKGYAHFSDQATLDRLICQELCYDFTGNLKFKIRRRGEVRFVSFNLERAPVKLLEAPQMLSDEVLYVHALHFPKHIFQRGMKKLKQQMLSTDTVVLDLREAEVPYLIRNVFAKSLFEETTVHTTVIPDKRAPRPGDFVLLKQHDVCGKKSQFDGVLVVLVNGETGSIGESTCLALQQYKNTIVVGTGTWGSSNYAFPVQVINESIFSMFTIAATVLNDGQLYDNSGIQLDYFVDFTKQDEFDWEDDYVLESALRYIRGK